MDKGKRNEPLELLAILILALLLRLYAGRNFLTENGVIMAGYDEYYHMRRILYTVSHFPNTLWFDSYLDYPFGLDITWPPLYDQISAAASLALGQHSQSGVEYVSAFVPVIFGVLAVLVVYFLVRELFDSKVALLASFLAAFAPYHISFTHTASTDHHSLEALLLLSIILVLTLALTRTEKRYMFAALAGLVIAGMAYTWLGTGLYLGMFLFYAAAQMTLNLKRGYTGREPAITLLAAFGVALLLTLPFWNAPWMWSSFYAIGGIFIAVMVMSALSTIVTQRKMSWVTFPLSLLALGIVFLILSLSFGLFRAETLIDLGQYFLGGQFSGKIAEAEPLITNFRDLITLIFSWLGLILLFALAGIAVLARHMLLAPLEKSRPLLLLLVWAVYLIILTFGQIRFFYITSIACGILISVLFFQILDMGERRMAKGEKGIPKAWPILLLLLLALPLVAEGWIVAATSQPAVNEDWYESMRWLNVNSEPTSYFDDPSENPEYSIMNWWDYGNWILYLSKRPVVANNFQVGVADSARFFVSESENEATDIMDSRSSRYVVIEYEMLYNKFYALARWAGVDPTIYLRLEDYDTELGLVPLQKLLDTTMARLYLFDGVGMNHFRLVHESSTLMGANPPKSQVKIFEYVPGALIVIQSEPDQRAGALVNLTSNQGRPFTYVSEGQSTDGGYEVRVPYSTEGNVTWAKGPYLVFAGSERGIKMQNINVSEEDVLLGRTINVSL